MSFFLLCLGINVLVLTICLPGMVLSQSAAWYHALCVLVVVILDIIAITAVNIYIAR